jgi:DNA-binding NarL/FixJ family response regulator
MTTRETGLTGMRVFLAEDEFLIALAVAEELEAKGCTIVGPFQNVAAARAAAIGESFDFALLDINMNGEMAYAVADEVAARQIPFVFLSGYSASALPERFRDIPAISKPCDPTILMKKLSQLLSIKA